MKKAAIYMALASMTASCAFAPRATMGDGGGEVTGIRGVALAEPTPYGMVLVDRGSMKVGPNQDDSTWCPRAINGGSGCIFQYRNILNILRVDSVDTTFHAINQNQWTTTGGRLSSTFVMMPLMVPFNNHRGSGNRIRLIGLILLNHNLCSMILKELL